MKIVFAAKKGMTLVEILVSLTILTVMLGAIFSILNIQRTKAVNVQTTSILQTDAQLALSLFRWDIFMAGYGMSEWHDIFLTTNSSAGSDSLGMYSMAFGFESGTANWSPVLGTVSGSDKIEVFRYDDSLSNFKLGDKFVIVSQEFKVLETGLRITRIDTTIHLAGQSNIPAFLLTLNKGVTISQGALAIEIDSISFYQGISYYINNQNQLMRGTQVFLDNVEDIQFKYGVDRNNNGIIQDNEWSDDLSDPIYTPKYLSEHTTMVRATFIVLSERGLGDYRYPNDSISVEDHKYLLTNLQKKYKRAIVRSLTFPRNLRT